MLCPRLCCSEHLTYLRFPPPCTEKGRKSLSPSLLPLSPLRLLLSSLFLPAPPPLIPTCFLSFPYLPPPIFSPFPISSSMLLSSPLSLFFLRPSYFTSILSSLLRSLLSSFPPFLLPHLLPPSFPPFLPPSAGLLSLIIPDLLHY